MVRIRGQPAQFVAKKIASLGVEKGG